MLHRPRGPQGSDGVYGRDRQVLRTGGLAQLFSKLINNQYIEYGKNENALQLKQYLETRETITSKSCYQLETKIISDNIKEYH